jgi:3-hydroxyacyl-CoA dehydrogenase
MTSSPGKELTSPSLAENPKFARERLVTVGDVIRTLRVSAHATVGEFKRSVWPVHQKVSCGSNHTARSHILKVDALHEVNGASEGRARAALARIRYSSVLADAAGVADLVIEAAPGVPQVKRELFTKLGVLAPKKTIFATNSSTLLPSALADATGRPERFLALHFANEIWSHNIAEIMGHLGTDPAVYDTVVDFAPDRQTANWGSSLEPVLS